MSQIVAPGAKSAVSRLSIESIPFSDIPGQPRLFLDYLVDPAALRDLYPSAARSIAELADHASDVIAGHKADRNALADALRDQNLQFGAPTALIENIERLRAGDSVAVVTGQQAGLFTGPLYTIYKALTAVAAADRLREQGLNAVPVFWVADEDHDFAEVSHTFVGDGEGGLAEIKVDPARASGEIPVGDITLDAKIDAAVSRLFESLPSTEFTRELRHEVESAWQSGTGYAEAFAKQMTAMLGRFGLVMLSPSDSAMKRLAASIYADAVRRSRAIEEALIARSELLTERGYTPQVLIDEGYFPLFYHTNDGRRVALKRNGEKVRLKGEREEFTLDELAGIAEREPERFSPNVMLRAAVQDYLLPTICYFGGGAEVAYFAQNSETYRILGRRPSAIFHRQSFTIMERRHSRILDRFGLGLTDLFAGRDAIAAKVVDEDIGRDTARLIADVEERINTELARLDHRFSEIDVTLAANLATRRRKIIYHIAALRDKFRQSAANGDEVTRRRLDSIFAGLVPNDGLQERTLNVTNFTARYGSYFIDWLRDSIDPDERGHRIIKL